MCLKDFDFSSQVSYFKGEAGSVISSDRRRGKGLRRFWLVVLCHYLTCNKIERYIIDNICKVIVSR